MVSTLKKIEFVFIFLLLPTVIFYLDSVIIAFSILYLIFCVSGILLYFDKNFKFFLLKKKTDWRFIFKISIVFIILGFFYTILLDKNLLFSFPKSNVYLWLTVIFVYPFLSVIPQEMIYRVLFFHRYCQNSNNLFLPLVINLMVFSYAHLIFHNIHALFITAFASPIFAYAYLKKSFFTCIILHSLGGQIIFTLGLGKFFF